MKSGGFWSGQGPTGSTLFGGSIRDMWQNVANQVGTNEANNSFGIKNTTTDEIGFPQRETYSNVLPGIKEAVGSAPEIKIPTLGAAPKLGQVQTIPGFDQSYWDSLYAKSRKSMADEYFGADDSLQNKLIENMNRRGLLGTSVEQKGQQKLYKSYGEKLADVESNLSRMQMEQKLQEAQEARRLQQERDITSGGWTQARDLATGEWGTQAALKGADLDTALRELAMRSALTETAEANKFNIGRFEQQVNLEDIMREDSRSRQQNLIELLTSPNFELPEEDIPALLDAIYGGYSGPSIYGGGSYTPTYSGTTSGTSSGRPPGSTSSFDYNQLKDIERLKSNLAGNYAGNESFYMQEILNLLETL